jgi:hypothetical protein
LLPPFSIRLAMQEAKRNKKRAKLCGAAKSWQQRRQKDWERVGNRDGRPCLRRILLGRRSGPALYWAVLPPGIKGGIFAASLDTATMPRKSAKLLRVGLRLTLIRACGQASTLVERRIRPEA